MNTAEAAALCNVSTRSFVAHARWNGLKKLKNGTYSRPAVERLARKIAAKKAEEAAPSPAEA